MTQEILPPEPSSTKAQTKPLSAIRVVIAVIIAGVADALSVGLAVFIGLEVLVDIIVAILLCLTLGFNWLLLSALVVEAIPGIAVFPTWTAAVLAIAVGNHVRKKQ